ncbi:hypothetical protein EAE32_09620 [Kocuria tytonicola]|uniref:Tetratricopeptide repeat protein n=1 Tax=Kocuria tytonicola TaxID=2055946 RepID=A0A3L9L0C2_9MICC|nr:hypothetical protein [Kocuria tytonicola]RLY92383.1 hypothetical protein EAE32_09620 [Kocuria tytonicola]
MTAGQGRGGLRWWATAAIVLLVLTVLLLPISVGSTTWIVAVLVFAGVFTVLEVGSAGRALAALMIALLTLYLGLSLQRAVLLLETPGWIPRVLGVAMLVIPAVGAWAMVREIVFGARTQQLGRELAANGELPADDLPRTPAGRYVRSAADERFDVVRREVEAAPEQWGGWYRLSLAYSASGDGRRARAAMRTAIALHRSGSPETVLAGSGR